MMKPLIIYRKTLHHMSWALLKCPYSLHLHLLTSVFREKGHSQFSFMCYGGSFMDWSYSLVLMWGLLWVCIFLVHEYDFLVLGSIITDKVKISKKKYIYRFFQFLLFSQEMCVLLVFLETGDKKKIPGVYSKYTPTLGLQE